MSVDGDGKDNDGDSRRRVDLLDTLLFAVNEKGEALTDSELCDQLYAFFLAGVETTATTMSWVIWEMCKQPGLTQELYNEVDSIPYPIGNDAHRKAPILTATFNEVLRLYPPVPNLCRQTLSPVAGLATYPETIIPTGMQVIVSIYDLLRDPRYWSEPDKFDLTRWLDTERAKSINTNAYIPFSSGPRICIGKQFFYLEGATLMYTLLRRFRFEATNNPMNGQLNSATGLLKPQAVEVYIYRR
ncbi:cytochrome P450 [Ramicandelaber brevisporus]|nr:cytochrome P450 [Ramicandelaber brevisporus]